MASASLADMLARMAARREAVAAERAALAVKASAARAKSALTYRQRHLEKARAAERANYAANPSRHHRKARRYRLAQPDTEAARVRRWHLEKRIPARAAAKLRAAAERERKARCTNTTLHIRPSAERRHG
jgi:hypothetical protein